MNFTFIYFTFDSLNERIPFQLLFTVGIFNVRHWCLWISVPWLFCFQYSCLCLSKIVCLFLDSSEMNSFCCISSGKRIYKDVSWIFFVFCDNLTTHLPHSWNLFRICCFGFLHGNSKIYGVLRGSQISGVWRLSEGKEERSRYHM